MGLAGTGEQLPRSRWWLDELVLPVLGKPQTECSCCTERRSVAGAMLTQSTSRRKSTGRSQFIPSFLPNLVVSLSAPYRDPNMEPEVWFAECQPLHHRAEGGRAALELRDNSVTVPKSWCTRGNIAWWLRAVSLGFLLCKLWVMIPTCWRCWEAAVRS